jgi:hypothetical protein
MARIHDVHDFEAADPQHICCASSKLVRNQVAFEESHYEHRVRRLLEIVGRRRHKGEPA